jgi:elongation factor Ts
MNLWKWTRLLPEFPGPKKGGLCPFFLAYFYQLYRIRRLKMAAITASMVAELRGKTDAPMMECKRALTEADGDMAKAEELLRVKLGSKAGKAASRVTAEGVVTYSFRWLVGALLEVNCETDFVTKNDSFLAWPTLPLRWCQAQSRLTWLHWVPVTTQDGFGPTLEDVRKGLIGKIGENMSFRRFKRFASGSQAGLLPARHPHWCGGGV